jgi:hypothetical protein
MKTLRVNLLLVVLLLLAISVHAERTTKKVYRSYALSQVQKVDVTNKYGHIYIDDNRRDSVIVDVEIWVEGTNEKARKLLDKINVSVSLSGGTLTAVTNLENISNNNQEFSIDYRISVPADRDLAIDQKYGTVTMKDLTGKGKFVISYGELTAQNLLSPTLSIDIAYSKANIEQTNDLDLVLRYSSLSLDKGNILKLETRYSQMMDLGEINGITVDSRYDHYKIKTVGTLKMNSMYTSTQVDKLNSKLSIENGYGSLTIDEIPAGFESISIINKYAGIRLGIASDASYKLDGKVRYSELKHPDGKFINRMHENASYQVNGTIGKLENPKSTVTVESSYGSVNLMH